MGPSDLHVFQVLPRLGRHGGAEVSTSQLAGKLRERGIRLSVAYFFDHPVEMTATLEAKGVEVRHLDAGSPLGRIRQLRSWLRAGPPDVLHAALWDADITSRLAAAGLAVPVLSSLVSTTYSPIRRADPAVSRPKLAVVRLIDRVTVRLLVDHVHAISDTVAEAGRTDLGIAPERITVVRRGRDRSRLGEPGPDRRRSARAAEGLGPDDVLVLAVGRQEYAKGLEHLVAAAPKILAAHAGAQVWVAGPPGARSGILRHQLEDLGLGGSVRLLGPRDDVPELLAAADVFAFPSLFEGSPGALVEAMAMEVPIVAADICAVRELLDETTAVLVPATDSEALAAGVVSVLDDRGAARVRAAAARARFDEVLSLDRCAAAMADLYRRVAERG